MIGVRMTTGVRWGLAVVLSAAGIAAVPVAAQEAVPDGRGRRVLEDPEALLRRVLEHIEDSYVEPVDRRALIYAAIRGMVRDLDPHSDFLDPQQYRAFQEDLSGIYGGAGFQVEYRGGRCEVVKVFPESPALRVGIRPGDRLIEVGGFPLFGLSVPEVLERMRGEVGTVMELRLSRGDGEPWTVRLVRQIVEMPTVEARFLEPGYALVTVHYFHHDAARRIAEELRVLDGRSPDGLRGVVIDLRHNPGGLVDEAVATADLFLADGVIVSVRGRSTREDRTASAGGPYESLPVSLVVNGYTASAAEILAAALQENGRAVVVGTQTFGKGTVQRAIELLDGSALRLTVSRFFSPGGTAIQGNGVVPDLTLADPVVEPAVAPALRETDLPGALEVPDASVPRFDAAATIEDPHVRLAYQVLRMEERRDAARVEAARAAGSLP
jgi:carboxyl-terminal processing protease